MHLKASSSTAGLLGILGILSKRVNSVCEGAPSGQHLLANHGKPKTVWCQRQSDATSRPKSSLPPVCSGLPPVSFPQMRESNGGSHASSGCNNSGDGWQPRGTISSACAPLHVTGTGPSWQLSALGTLSVPRRWTLLAALLG